MSRNSKCLVAYDFSESTVDSRFYHTTVQNIVQQYENYDVILWSNKLKVSNPNELRRINNEMDGQGGTCPKLIAEYLVDKDYSYLVIITDGQIFERYVKELDDFLVGKQLSLNHVDCYLIQTSPEKLDATVIAPFLRNIPHLVFLYNTDAIEPVLLTQGDKTAEELIQTIANIKTIEEFESIYDNLFSDVVTQMLGKTQNLFLRKELLALQSRLIDTMRETIEGTKYAELLASYQQYMDMIEKNPEAKDDAKILAMVEIINEMNTMYFQKYREITWPPKLFHLIRMCSGNLGSIFTLAALSSRFNADRVHREDVIRHLEISEVPIVENVPEDQAGETTTRGAFVCPVTYEEAHDVMLMIAKPETPLLKTLGDQLENQVIANPLNAIQYPEFISKLVDCIDHPISLKAVKDAETIGKPINTSPLTRRPLVGGLCLSKDEKHCEMTDFTISQVLSEGKLEGSLDLWYILIWFLIETGKVHHCKEIIPQLREHLFYRLTKHESSLSLMTVLYYCITKVPLGVGIISAIFSSKIAGDNLNVSYENIKAHLPRIEILLKVCDFMHISIPAELKKFITKALAFNFLTEQIAKKNFALIDTFMRLTYHTLLINKDAFRFAQLIEAIHEKNREAQANSRANRNQRGRGRRTNRGRGRRGLGGRGGNGKAKILYQQVPKKLTEINHRYIPQYIPIDGPQTEEEKNESAQLLSTLPEFIKQLTISELRSATRILKIFSKTQVTFNDMYFDEKASTPIVPAWPNYGDHPIQLPEIKICPLTMRPFTTVDAQSWDKLSEQIFGPLIKQIHLHQMYINFVIIFKVFPNRDEFIAYIYNELIPSGKTALPMMINEYVTNVFDGYNKIFETHQLSPKAFIKTTDISRNVEERKKLEAQYLETNPAA